jgi:hypothetical protein
MISKQSSSVIVIALALVYAAKPSVAKHEQINKLVSTSNAISALPVLGKHISLCILISHKSLFLEPQ